MAQTCRGVHEKFHQQVHVDRQRPLTDMVHRFVQMYWLFVLMVMKSNTRTGRMFCKWVYTSTAGTGPCHCYCTKKVLSPTFRNRLYCDSSPLIRSPGPCALNSASGRDRSCTFGAAGAWALPVRNFSESWHRRANERYSAEEDGKHWHEVGHIRRMPPCPWRPLYG